MIKTTEGIRLISLDVWSTLIEPNPKFKNARTDLFRHFFNLSGSVEQASAALSETAALVNQLNSISGKCMDRSETILLALHRMDHPFAEITEEKLHAFFSEMDTLFEEYPPFLAHPAIPELMQEMTGNYIFSILSNTLYIQGKSLRAFFGSQHMLALFSFDIYSDEINASKPSQHAFGALINQAKNNCGVHPSEIMHVGDNLINDVEGARKAGLKAGLVNENQPLVSFFRP